MDYLHTHPDAVVGFHASDIILYIESDAAYLILPQACSRVASIFYLSNATAGNALRSTSPSKSFAKPYRTSSPPQPKQKQAAS